MPGAAAHLTDIRTTMATSGRASRPDYGQNGRSQHLYQRLYTKYDPWPAYGAPEPAPRDGLRQCWVWTRAGPPRPLGGLLRPITLLSGSIFSAIRVARAG